MATIYDIANLCRTSIATVSYVLNGRGDEHRISKATQEKVLSVAESLNYRPNTSAKRLSSDSAHQLSIALFWPNYYFEQALISALRAVNEVTKLFSEPAEINLQFYEPDTLVEKQNILSSQLYNGIIIAGASNADLQFLAQPLGPVPTVLLNRRVDEYPYVTIDHATAGRLACDIVASCSPESVATIWERQYHVATNTRRDAFLKRWDELGLGAENNQYFCAADAEAGYSLGIKLIQKRQVPRAIFCNQEEIARGLLAALVEFGVAVGTDTYLLTTNTGPDSLSRFTSPSMTTIDLRMQAVAAETLKLCFNLISRRADPKTHMVIQPEVTFRDSFPELAQRI